MDLGLIIGLALGFSSIVGSFLWEGGKIGSLVQGPAMLIIFGGTMAATLSGMPLKKFLDAWRVASKAVFAQRELYNESRAAGDGNLDVDGTAVLAHDLAAERQPESRPLVGLLGGEERLEDLFP